MSPCPLLQQAVDEKNTIIRYRKAKEHEAQVGTSPISVSRDVRHTLLSQTILAGAYRKKRWLYYQGDQRCYCNTSRLQAFSKQGKDSSICAISEGDTGQQSTQYTSPFLKHMEMEYRNNLSCMISDKIPKLSPQFRHTHISQLTAHGHRIHICDKPSKIDEHMDL